MTDVDPEDTHDGEVTDDEDGFIPVELVTPASDVGAVEHASDAEGAAPSVLDRLVRVGISRARAQAYLSSGAVRVDGERVTDPNRPAAPPARIVLLPA